MIDFEKLDAILLVNEFVSYAEIIGCMGNLLQVGTVDSHDL